MEFPYVKKTDFLYSYKDNVTVSEPGICKISTYSRKFKSLVNKKNGSTSFSLLEYIAHPSSNSPGINITANILLRL